jgi:predicted RNA binding protein YcfA (HicA-like mRNA interferase family)
MKKRRIRGKYASPALELLERAGYEFSHHGRSNGSHLIFKAPGKPNAVLPSDLDCKSTYLKIVRSVQLSPG